MMELMMIEIRDESSPIQHKNFSFQVILSKYMNLFLFCTLEEKTIDEKRKRIVIASEREFF